MPRSRSFGPEVINAPRFGALLGFHRQDSTAATVWPVTFLGHGSTIIRSPHASYATHAKRMRRPSESGLQSSSIPDFTDDRTVDRPKGPRHPRIEGTRTPADSALPESTIGVDDRAASQLCFTYIDPKSPDSTTGDCSPRPCRSPLPESSIDPRPTSSLYRVYGPAPAYTRRQDFDRT